MEFIIEQAMLLKTLTHVHSVVERRNTIPILSNVLLRVAEDGQLFVIATDLDMQIIEGIPVKTIQAGSATLIGQTLFEIARKAPEGAEINFSMDDGRVQIKTGRTVFALPTLPPEDFPVIPEDDMAVRFTLPAKTLAMLIDKTRCAISSDEMRHFLNGVFLHVADSKSDSKTDSKTDGDSVPVMNAVATDGHRLAKVSIPPPDGSEDMPDIIIPRKSILELRKLLEDVDNDDIEIALSSNRICFTVGKAVLLSKLIEGSFPDYNRVVPTANDKLLTIDSTPLAHGVDRVTAIAQEKTRSVRLKLDRDHITLSYKSTDHGTAVEELTCSYDSSEIEVGFNSTYLLDILEQVNGTVEIHFATAGDPALIRGSDDESVLYVLMPMRV